MIWGGNHMRLGSSTWIHPTPGQTWHWQQNFTLALGTIKPQHFLYYTYHSNQIYNGPATKQNICFHKTLFLRNVRLSLYFIILNLLSHSFSLKSWSFYEFPQVQEMSPCTPSLSQHHQPLLQVICTHYEKIHNFSKQNSLCFLISKDRLLLTIQ